MAVALIYITCVVSFDSYNLSGIVPYIFYPVIMMSLAEIPYSMIFKRTLISLPFCLFAGLSNLFFDHGIALMVGNIAVSYGAVSFIAILYRALLCVSAILILVAVTPVGELTAQLRRLRVPDMLVSLFEMTYRYIGTLLGESSSMYTAYRLRSRNYKGLELKHMGSFVGQLFIRSFDRAERIFNAMKCRGYPSEARTLRRQFTKADACFFVSVAGLSVLFRCVDIMSFVSRLFGGLL